jgi:hypothetical protein
MLNRLPQMGCASRIDSEDKMRHIDKLKAERGLGLYSLEAVLALIIPILSFLGCGAQDTLAKAEDSLTCDGNKIGWFCVSNPELAVDPSDGLTENQRVMCDGKGNVWITTKFGIWRYNGNSWSRFGSDRDGQASPTGN